VPEAEIEAVIGDQAAEALGLAVGDSFTLEQRGWDSSVPVPVRIVGIVHQGESDLAAALGAQRVGRSSQGEFESNLLMTRASFIRVAEQHVPDSNTVIGWWVTFDHNALAFVDLPDALHQLDEFHQHLLALYAPEGAGLNFIYQSDLVPILEDYRSEVTTLRAPFGLLLLQVGALASFFLVVTAALVRRGGRREVAMLQSRGAANQQLILLDGLEALVICALAVVVAPFLACWFLEWIVPALTRIETLDLTPDRDVFIYAAGAAVVSWIVLTATLYPVLRLPLTSAGGSKARGESQFWWQRYYVDVVLLVIGVAVLWRLITNKSPLRATQTGH
jgi:putative ABC transport system permease protein